MESMINENLLTFKELEGKIFHAVCEVAARTTAEILRIYDVYLMENRDRKRYRHKGLKETTIKTLYGEVTFQRALYATTDEDGLTHYVFLLDRELGLGETGLFSENYVEKLVSGITTKSYRDCAKEVSETTGQSISAMGVWNIVQALGEKICREEKALVKQHKKGRLEGRKEVPVIFEESDGVNLKLQGKDRKATETGKAEMKVAIAYDGWKKTGEDRYQLDGKVAFAGFSKSGEFHRIREAKIAKEYKVEEALYRILNGDGAGWIKNVPDQDTLFQLDTFHRNKAIRENLPYKKAREDVMELIREKKIKELFEYLTIYRDSLDDEKEIKKAEDLIKYFKNNKKGLIPYQDRNITIPENPEGLSYRAMGTMEGHIWSIIARRMKHNHTVWSKAGANHLAKILAKKCEGKLGEVTKRLEAEALEDAPVEEALGGILSAAKAPLYDGKGYEYPVRGSVVSINEALRGDPKKLFYMAGY